MVQTKRLLILVVLFLFTVPDLGNPAVNKIHMALVSCSLQYKENTDGKKEKMNS